MVNRWGGEFETGEISHDLIEWRSRLKELNCLLLLLIPMFLVPSLRKTVPISYMVQTKDELVW